MGKLGGDQKVYLPQGGTVHTMEFFLMWICKKIEFLKRICSLISGFDSELTVDSIPTLPIEVIGKRKIEALLALFLLIFLRC